MDLWSRKVSEKYLPLYEAKMIHQFDHRFATFDEGFRDVTPEEKADPSFEVMPRYWVPEASMPESSQSRDFFLGFRDICRSTDERTVIASIVPRAGVNHKLPLILNRHTIVAELILAAMLNSFCLDFVARSFVGGTSLTFFIVKQLPILNLRGLLSCADETRMRLILSCMIELVATSSSMERLAERVNYHQPPTNPASTRTTIICAEIDAAFFHFYGIPRGDVDYIMETFPIVKRKDIKEHGSFHTKELILEAYDAMAEAERTGVPYQSPLDPPPANGWVPSDELIEEARRSLEQGEPA
jgi:hypothetical protein